MSQASDTAGSPSIGRQHVKRSRLVIALAAPLTALACVAAGSTAGAAPTLSTASSGASGVSTADEATPSPLRLTAPRLVEGYLSGTRVEFDPSLRLVAQGAPFEIRSKRTAYGAPIVTTWHHGGEVVTLPRRTVTDFAGLPGFLRMDFRKGGELVTTRYRSGCLNSWSTERAHPDAPLRSPYPQSCSTSRIMLGSVMGIQEGYATRLDSWMRLKLAPGRYQVTVAVTAKYRTLFGIPASDGVKTFTLRVSKDAPDYDDHERRTVTPSLRPGTTEPTRAAAGAPGEPQPDLRSIPAFGIRVDGSGNYLQFSANVWNAGNSPLVVDGFRRPNEDIMDAYQYFLDADGNQVGYRLVGTMAWDNKDTHQHWHFRDFARYRLLDAHKVGVVRSRKEAFCLANTDAIDYTVDGADWQPDTTDLHTACGERDSLSIREVLASGSGDTYAQFRAGQSFSLKGLPNGVYYIAVEANPVHNLVESDTTNNVAYRKVLIGGRLGARTVKVYPMNVD
ncbi:hypothetical protein ASD30_18080 [Nocardioides sp. Root140]|nr:hypothetical protein ASD30_18080 [Nocardioides sp. Root140]